MAEDYYSKKQIGERIRVRLNPPVQGNTLQKLKEEARKLKR